MGECTPRRRWAERDAAEKQKAAEAEARRWKDPLTPLERWFTRLPNLELGELGEQCSCGSGKPVLYWTQDDGSGCEDCCGAFGQYIPEAVMYHVMDKFGIPADVRKRVYAQVEEQRTSRAARSSLSFAAQRSGAGTASQLVQPFLTR
jgi:hypothetical protein